MVKVFIHSFQSEWLKRKRSAATWLMIVGAFLIPVIFVIARIVDFDNLYSSVKSEHFWEILFRQSWQSMAIFMLPFGVILATSLITQLEYKNNTWKQLHTSPQSLTVIFFSKLSVIVAMMMQFFILFNLGIYLSGMLPSIIFREFLFLKQVPWEFWIKSNIKFFISCLPIIALQYLLSIQFKNFLVPLGFGIGLFVASMIAMNWKHGYLIPYIFCTLTFVGPNADVVCPLRIHWMATIYFVFFTIVSCLLYINKKEKG
ncbi:MAG: ABC transporter permease [Sphingobacteriaceae bacterium]|nr:ABC transporter permease [Sphingobacteriaceae bacterium]